MDLRDYTRLLRRRWHFIALLALVGVAGAVAATYTATKMYTANAQLFVSAQDQAATGSLSSAYTGGLFTQQRVKSYVEVLTSDRTAELVRNDTGLDRSAADIKSEVSASAPLDTVLINISVTDPDPAIAQQLANSFGKVFPGVVTDIETPMDGGLSPIRVSLVQPADLPTLPTSPRPKLNLALGLLVGLGLGVGAAVLRETLDTSIKSADEVVELIGAPLLGAINYDPKSVKSPLVVVTKPGSVRAEAFRQLRTNLQFVDVEHPLRSVVITSSLPGEGKSTTACNLSIALAQAGLKVILVEADLRRPKVADYLGLESAVGVTSVLLGRVDLETALQPWGEDGLRVLASGPLPPNPSELLGSPGMTALLRATEGLADLVIIDAPPLLPVTDAAVLGTVASGVMLVVHSNKTRREQIQRAAGTLNAVGTTLLGAVLNRVPIKGANAYAYSYGYGYEYTSRGGSSRLSREESMVLPSHSTAAATADEPGITLAPEPAPPSAPLATAPVSGDRLEGPGQAAAATWPPAPTYPRPGGDFPDARP